MRVAITVDVEQDCPPYLSTWRGIKEGLPSLLELLREENIPATFFCTGEMVRKYPDATRSIVDHGHELGSHGNSHKKFTEMSDEEAKKNIFESMASLRPFSSVTSFRAPYLKFPDSHVRLLGDAGFTVDSSEARYKKRGASLRMEEGLLRIPASMTSSTLRYPFWIRNVLFRTLTDPVVLFVHPWEFVDFRQSSLRLDCRFKTGDTALRCLRTTIEAFRSRGGHFLRLREVPHPA